MKELLVLSGKGGTGKTTLSSAFIEFGKIHAYSDCDVDAPNLHILHGREEEPSIRDFFGLNKALIDEDLCTQCGICLENCRFSAIDYEDGVHRVDYYACEGCSVCEYLCPVDAISMEKAVAGDLMLYSEEKIFSTAKLRAGSGNSGLLVTEVKNQMKDRVKEEELDLRLAIIDGSPGIGCPVIASITGVDMVLIVAEPSVTGISDMERIVKTCENFEVKIGMCINKYDINLDNTRLIESYCEENGIPLLGKIPYDKMAHLATNQGLSIAEIDCESGREARKIYNKIKDMLL